MLRPHDLNRPGSSPAPESRACPTRQDQAAHSEGSTAVLHTLQSMTDEARAMIGARHAVARVAFDANGSQVLTVVSVSTTSASWKSHPPVTDGPTNAPVIRPLARSIIRPGFIAAPLVNTHGRNFGAIELTDKEAGDFSPQDELNLVRFATGMALAIENALTGQADDVTPTGVLDCIAVVGDTQQPTSLKKADSPWPINPRGHETVLLVEDEDIVRNLIHHVLTACGYVVLAAMNGQEALALAEQHAAPIDLLVSDVVMPILGGRALADRLLKLRPNLKVLFFSGYSNEAVAQHGVSESDFAFLQKPFSTGALAQKVRDVLDQPAK